MTQAVPAISPLPIGGMKCPRRPCGGTLIVTNPGVFRCPTCGFTAFGEIFSPPQRTPHMAEIASNEDASCVYHPHKKAVAVCQGTGNFICALCAVDLKGKTFSVQYLESSAGKQLVDESFSRFLPRPDRVLNNILIAALVPYTDIVVLVPFPIWAVFGYYKCAQTVRLRRENALYRDLVGRSRAVVGAVLLSLLLLIWTMFFAAFLYIHLRGQTTVYHGYTQHAGNPGHARYTPPQPRPPMGL